MIENQIPNCGIETNTNDRRGRSCNIPTLKKQDNKKYTKIFENSFYVEGPRLFNTLPKSLRNFKGSQKNFEKLLDKLMKIIPDIPEGGNNSLTKNEKLASKEVQIWADPDMATMNAESNHTAPSRSLPQPPKAIQFFNGLPRKRRLEGNGESLTTTASNNSSSSNSDHNNENIQQRKEHTDQAEIRDTHPTKNDNKSTQSGGGNGQKTNL